MCEHCDEDTERIRTVVDALIESEAALRRAHARAHTPLSQGQHVVRLANTILSTHQDDRGYMGQDDVHAMAMGYALVTQRLLALQEMSGISP